MTLPSHSNSNYRADIDGLRGLAVLAVILFHVDPNWMPGGFVGVDIFFVISGYLITGIVAKELQEERFTFRQFYERRIRRILPALWTLLIICVPVSWLLMLPQDAEQMGKSALWSSLAMGNVYFWREVSTDYFAPQSAQLPFLHLWSLGVEEQFYVIWPALLLAVWHFARQRAQAIAFWLALAIVLASTMLAEWLLSAKETRYAYYMLPPRAGELALGAALVLARLPSVDRVRVANVGRIAAVIGWGLLAYSLVSISEDDPFPGWRALPPTIGAAALILSGRLGLAGSWLAPLRWGPSVWLGRCSYSAYLWHWPVLAWWRYLWGQPGTAEGLALLTLILVLARASQLFVEDPVRLSRDNWPRSLVLYGIAPALLVGVMALLVVRGERWGLPLYAEFEVKSWAELDTYTRPAHRFDWVCQQHYLNPKSLTDPKCEFGSGESPARILLLGDSHAAEFAPVFRVAAEVQHMRVRSVALGACAPLAGSLQDVVTSERVKACEAGVPRILERAGDFPLLIIGAAWDSYARNEPGTWVRLERQLREFIDRGHRVWLLPRVPAFSSFDAACLAKRVRVGDWLQCPTELVPRETHNDTNARLMEIAQRIPGVKFLPLHGPLCASARACPVTDTQGNYLYADPSHLSVHGARYLASILMRENRLPDLSESLSPETHFGRSDR